METVHRHLRRLLFALDAAWPATLLRHIAPRHACSHVGDHTVVVQTVFHQLIYVDARDVSLLPSLVLRGYWEPGVTRALLRLVRPGQRVIDVGANVGWYSLLLAAAVGPTGSVTAFEANPRALELLRQTLGANDQGHVRVAPLAVADAPGPRTLHRLAFQQGSSSLYPFSDAELAAWHDVATPVAVQATSLDAFFADDDRSVDLVKIDAEGAEPLILAGMTRLLERSPQVQLVIEFLPAMLARAGHDPRAVLAALEQHGFRLHTIDRRGGCRPTTSASLLASPGAELYLRR